MKNKFFIALMSAFLSAPLFAALPAAEPTKAPVQTATPKLSAIELYRQMTGRQAERVFPTATPVPAEAVLAAAAKAAAPASVTSTGWFLIAADAAMTGWAIFSLIDFNNSVDAYERLKTQLDVPPYDDYDFLIREQEKANGKVTITAITWSLAGVCLAYTAADLIWLHSAFPVKAGAAFNPKTGEVTASLNASF